jgi:hypothetical protein
VIGRRTRSNDRMGWRQGDLVPAGARSVPMTGTPTSLSAPFYLAIDQPGVSTVLSVGVVTFYLLREHCPLGGRRDILPPAARHRHQHG